MNKKIIVTGGCGFIGSHTAIELIQNNFEVVLLDDLSNSSIDTVTRIRKVTGINPNFVKVDLKDETATLNVFKNHSDAIGVIHFAAHKAVGESSSKPLNYYENNLKSTIHVLKAIQLYGITNLIFSSSATVYGIPDILPLSEVMPMQRPLSPYGNTKKITEEILEDVVKASNLKVISLRYFNPIGAHPSGLIGELPQGTPNNLLPYINQAASGKLKELQIFGEDYPTRDGTPERDYIHVVDVAIAHIKAINHLLKSKNIKLYDSINLGTGRGYTVKEIIHTFQKTTKMTLNYKIVNRREGDVPKLYANAEKALTVIGWQAERDLKQMITDGWKWEQSDKE